MTIKIPAKFNQIISKKQKLSGALNIALSSFSEWIKDNKLEFFPEYTDHGVEHINSVLETAEDIISQDCYSILTADDIYVLCVSILLHDCAMHVNKQGLWNLLENEQYNGIPLGFNNDIEWKEKWFEFTRKVDRFTEADWNNLYSEFRNVKLPDIGTNSLDDNQKILIGDFIRQHHASIAQLIANIGIPTGSGPLNILIQEFSYLNQLAGFIARSHNMNLRNAIDILGSDKSRVHRDTHPAFLMGVLRIADYLQFKSDRTPKILFSIKYFCSPVSINEWKKHLSIISTNNSHPDEELLYVEAFPEDPIILNSISSLLSGLQRELDDFWAATGEIYSRYPELNKLGIIYRRIKSNIDNPKEYVSINHKNYHPEILKIESDNRKLFPLLIKPLYGNLATIGVRELIQNAIDACNERYAYNKKSKINFDDIPYGISITLDFDNKQFIIEDAGIGMDIDIVKNYFLKIGASYRTSEAWKNNYSSGDNSNLPRTGKFGIGMLAGFLIGHKIDIHTQHIDSKNKSVKFSYELDSDHIEVRFVKKETTGTAITIYTNEEKLNEIRKCFNENYNRHSSYYNYDDRISAWWYVFDTPKITVTMIDQGESTDIEPHYSIKKSSLITEKWRNIESNELDGFYWRNSSKQLVFCNGIHIHQAQSVKILINTGLQIQAIAEFEILFFDNGGNLPISLTREKFLTGEYYNSEALKSDFILLFKEKLLAKNKKYTFDLSFIKKILEIHQNLFRRRHYRDYLKFVPIVYLPSQMTPFISEATLSNIEYVVIDYILERSSRGIIYQNPFSFLSAHNIGITTVVDCDKNSESLYFAIAITLCNQIKSEENYGRWSNNSYFDNKIESFYGWVFVKKYDLAKIDKKLEAFTEQTEINIKNNTIIITSHNDDWAVLRNKDNNHTFPKLADEIIEMTNKEFVFSIIKPSSPLKTDIDF